VNNQLVNPKLLLDLPPAPGSKDNGGPVLIGPDSNVYSSIGHLAGDNDIGHQTKAQNFENGPDADGTSGIHRVTQDGGTVGSGILGSTRPLSTYYAYGVRNSFGMDFDPVTGILWDTENGPNFGDEINLVAPGFNSGWKDVMGLAPTGFNYNGLVAFNGNGKYRDPEFVWEDTVAPTALLFFNNDKFGPEYKNDMFVGDYAYGRIYHFELNPQRDGLLLNGPLSDKKADSDSELQGVIFGEGFGVPTDLEIGPDGMLYVLSLRDGAVYKVSRPTPPPPPPPSSTCAQLPLSSASATANGFDSPTPPSNTLDNNLNTRWSNLGLPSFIQYNLGQSELVCNVDIAWYNGNSRTVTFTISFSTDGSTFTNPQTFQSSRTTGPVNYDFPDVNAKYVRITVTKNTANNWASMTEADIYAAKGGGSLSLLLPLPTSGIAIHDSSSNMRVPTSNHDLRLPTRMNPEE
jgi:hypothetical protein